MRSKVDGKVNLLTGETSLRTDEYQWITPQKNADGSLEAVIYPQEAAPYREGDGLLKIITQGQESFLKLLKMCQVEPCCLTLKPENK